MALALLKFLSFQDGAARFRTDTGTNPFYLIRVGQGSYRDNGFEQLDGVTMETGLRNNEKSANLFDSDAVITIPADRFSAEACYVQLVSFKDRSGRSPAYSRVIKVRLPLQMPKKEPEEYSFSHSLNRFTMYQQPLNAHRNIPYVEARSLATQAGQQDWLRSMMEAAGPLVMGMLPGCQSGYRRRSYRVEPSISMLNTILHTFLHGWSNPSQLPLPGLSTPQSASVRKAHRFTGTRAFTTTAPTPAPTPTLPAFQDDTLIKSLFEELQKEAILKMFLENQQAMAAANPLAGLDINQLLQLLQQAQAPTIAPKPATPAPAPQQVPVAPTAVTQPAPSAPASATTPGATITPVAATKSLNGRSYSSMLSSKAILSFETGPKLLVNDKEQTVFKKQDIRLRLKLNVAGEAPRQPLPKAIVSFCWKDQYDKTLLEKIFKQKDIAAGEPISYTFTELELQPVPSGCPVTITAEMRWLNSEGIEVKTLGSVSIILTEGYWPKTGGKPLPGEQELADMSQYRSFWNKIWESPTAGEKSPGDTIEKKLWSLEADLKYSILVSGKNESNGLMDTRLALREKEAGGVTDSTEGKLKSGIELTVTELNKLSSLWSRQPLTNEKLAALRYSRAVTGSAFECQYHLRLKGNLRERGTVWIVPVLRLQEFILSQVKMVDESGQVTEMTEETVSLPMPVSVRIIGLKNT